MVDTDDKLYDGQRYRYRYGIKLPTGELKNAFGETEHHLGHENLFYTLQWEIKP